MPASDERTFPFSELPESDLLLDAVYQGGTAGHSGDDPIARLVRVGNQGGFRMMGSPWKRSVKLAVLYSSAQEPDWPDNLDVQTGRFTYYGDNRRPGYDLHDTRRGGNCLLRDTFAAASGSADDRSRIPPFLLFQKTGRGRDVRFRGLLAPGAEGLSSDDELVALWRSTRGQRFQNYRAVFTVLDTACVTREWINELSAGLTTGQHAPDTWLSWVKGRQYQALTAPATVNTRTRDEQTPTPGEQVLISEITEYFKDRWHDFEECAVALWRMQAPATGQCEVTPPYKDGGRDAIGQYMLGPDADPVPVEFALEAKCYGPDTSVGVRDVSRLISRLRNRQFGVFVTTSYFHAQAYQEVRDDHHPVVLMCGRDIADLLKARGFSSPQDVRQWLQASFPERP
ncbi:restriction endonuclease [Nocardiopsis sp. FIRDI 009]|uniref:restriction endonuclease n=1 Tax=Nocardiopsis sp. FIRDI 009 TaxID=714197 RepID=UPI000E25951C|nr:restriction endonuclease [Nocardiopsis sp. FIRDI 009]